MLSSTRRALMPSSRRFMAPFQMTSSQSFSSSASSTEAVMETGRLFSVEGKNVLVTGGSRGIGLMIAKGFAELGANVILTSRDPKACQEAVETHIGRPNCRHVAPSHLSTREGCEELAQKVAETFDGRLDVLINNAGTSWGEIPFKESRSNWGWDKVLDLNVKSIFYLTRACTPLLQRVSSANEQDASALAQVTDPGRVINIGSVTGFLPQEAPTHAYDVSKAAVHHLTKKLAIDLAPRGVTVNCVAPGFVPTRMSDGLATWGAEHDKIASGLPLRRLGDDQDMVGACAYFASRAGAYCTGVVLIVDGGTVGCAQIPLSSL